MFHVNAAEKGPCWFKVTASGEPGHGSRPAQQTSVSRLVNALHKLLEWERPYEVGPTVAGYYAAYAALDESRARQFRQLSRALEDGEFYRWFTAKPSWDALIRDTLSINVLRASAKTNVIPAQAEAEIDSRLLPGHSCVKFLNEVTELIGSEHVRVEKMDVAFPSSSSPLDNEFLHAVEKLAAAEQAVVLPGLLSGFTDSHFFREKGINAYGFIPLVVDSESRRSIHGPNERGEIKELEAAVHRLVKLLGMLGA